MAAHGRTRPRFAQQSAKYRRRRRAAGVIVLATLALVVLGLTAFRGSGSSSASVVLGPRGGWGAGKLTARHIAALPSLRAQHRAVERLISFGVPIYCAGGRGHYVGLTFDDGPSILTPRFQTLLRAAGARATFFIVGGNMVSPTLAALARSDTKLGALGDHTWSHANLKALGDSQVDEEIGRAKRAIVDATHAPVLVFRPPYAAHDSTVGTVTRKYGMLEILWNTDSRDWAGDRWQQIGDNVVAGLEPGSIVLMHDTREESIKALRDVILPELRRRHLTAVTLPELFALDPPSASQVRDDGARGACGRGQHDGT